MQNAFMAETLDSPGKRLRWVREKRGYAKAAEAARAMRNRGIRIADSTYQGHENGSRQVTRNMRSYARFFKCSEGWLRYGEGSWEPKSLDDRAAVLPPEAQQDITRFFEFLETKYQKTG